jgi:hypothetical protein
MVPAAFSAPDQAAPGRHYFFDVTITNGTSLSAAVDLGGLTLVGVLLPATWTAAGISFQAGEPTGTTFGKLVNSAGTEVTAAGLTGGEYVTLDPNAMYGYRHVKVRSGTNGTPVNQGADRVVRLIARGKGT